MSVHPTEAPRLVVADESGRMLDHPDLLAVGVRGPAPRAIPVGEWIPVPEGSDFYTLPGRAPVGLDPSSRALVVEQGADACSAFLAPAWTRSDRPAYCARPAAPALPLYAYAAVGFADGRFWTTGVRVDPDPRQDPATFDAAAVRRGTFRFVEAFPENRVAQQLARCALEYRCRAAQNYALGRHEAPLPTSVACNAQCVGCISLQPDGEFRASHDRLTRRVEPGEIVEVVLDHWSRVPDGVASFGQGCEGEPLLEADVLVESVRLLRRETGRGTINLNSNASLPAEVARLADAGLDTLRASLNSARADVHAAYYRPRHYTIADVEASVAVMKSRGRHASVNFLYHPGVSDTDAEIEALGGFLARTGADLVQVRNLNIDPEIYERSLPPRAVGEGCGPAAFMERLSARVPGIAFGYFNPTKERYREIEDARRALAAKP